MKFLNSRINDEFHLQRKLLHRWRSTWDRFRAHRLLQEALQVLVRRDSRPHQADHRVREDLWGREIRAVRPSQADRGDQWDPVDQAHLEVLAHRAGEVHFELGCRALQGILARQEYREDRVVLWVQALQALRLVQEFRADQADLDLQSDQEVQEDPVVLEDMVCKVAEKAVDKAERVGDLGFQVDLVRQVYRVCQACQAFLRGQEVRASSMRHKSRSRVRLRARILLPDELYDWRLATA